MKAIATMADSGLLSIVKAAGTSNSYRLNLEATTSIPQSHIVYETSDPVTGEFYIGLHSTYNINDGYLGSSRWIEYHKEKDRLTKRILFNFENREEAALKENELILKNINNEKCRNKGTTLDNLHYRSSTNDGTTNGGTTNDGTSLERDGGSTAEGTGVVPMKGHKPKKNLEVNLQDIYKKIELTNLTEEIERETAKELIDHRVNIKKPFTQQSFDRLIKKILKVKSDQEITLTPNQAIETIIDRGWQGFELDWLKSKEQKAAPQPTKRKPLPRPEEES
jgi:hypothetical protein